MKKKITHLILIIFVNLACAMPLPVQSMETLSTPEKQKQPSGMQLARGDGDILEAPLGTGSNALLKISMNLKDLRRCTEHELVDVPVRLFLTDFASSPVNHPSVNFQVKVDCELTPIKCVLPHKPMSFDSYVQFTHWLEQGYFTNQVSITYDFHVDVQKSAPSLAQQLFFLPPDGYRFIGTHVIDNPKIISDSCEPKVSYVSQRGDTNATTVILGGTLYLNKKSYPIDEHRQVLLHKMIEEKILENKSGRFYHYQWLARSQTILKQAYKESSTKAIKKWPKLPANKYTIIQRRWESKENVLHLSCMDGSSGEEIDITNGKVFWIKYPEERNGNIIESIVMDSEDNLYIVKYRNLHEEKKQEEERLRQLSLSLGIDGMLQEYTEMNNKVQQIEAQKRSIEIRISQLQAEHAEIEAIRGEGSHYRCSVGGDPRYYNYCRYCDRQRYQSGRWQELSKDQETLSKMENEANECTLRNKAKVIKELMESYLAQARTPHPRWDEFSKM